MYCVHKHKLKGLFVTDFVQKVISYALIIIKYLRS
jgi:hypothetical protein